MAIRQNIHRQEHVPSEVIEDMTANLQPPLPCEHNWESITCILQDDNLDKSQGAWYLIYQCFMSLVPQLKDCELKSRSTYKIFPQHCSSRRYMYMQSPVSQVIRAVHLKGNVRSNELSSLSCGVNVICQSILAAV
ncbi:hypothetical protein OTU49_005471 [Cherax quadricarinatus]|uniref:Uncharacterized protein n=1 Tax=Cherax quadricarinatus TaxID=27406 RepID=A0AAW0X6S2_CHEQU